MVVDNSTDFCGSNNYSDASEPNDNSVSRIPVRVWAVIMTITCWLIFSRYKFTMYDMNQLLFFFYQYDNNDQCNATHKQLISGKPNTTEYHANNMCIIIKFQPKTRGRVNGFGQSLAALGRMIGPVVGAPLFAWSENSGLIMWHQENHTSLAVFIRMRLFSVILILSKYYGPCKGVL